jgi:hypothetical protein
MVSIVYENIYNKMEKWKIKWKNGKVISMVYENILKNP